ncbi:hypothetical protein, conserved in T. vivax, (fragment), partial [Trypanosoma vivax Y486]
ELASLAASLAAPLDGKNESVVSAVKALQGKAAGDAERELKQAARGKTQAARALTVGSGSLRSFVETVAALGTSVNTGESYSCIDGEHKIAGGNLGDAENANTITDKTCREVESARWTDRDNLGQGQVTELLQALNRGTKLTSTSENIGGPVTSGATQPECRLLAVAANGRAGDGGLLLKAAGGTETRQNTVHLGTFVKITALAGGSVSFDEKRNLTDGMNVESALQAIDRARAAVARHKAFACSDNTCPALEEAKQTLQRTVAAIRHAAERPKSEQDEESSAGERTETQIKARTASANAEAGQQQQKRTESAQTGYTASDASQGVPFAATLALAAGTATTHFVPQQAARH